MYFKEIVVQGLFGVAKGLRLPLNDGLCEPLLPPPLDAEKFKKITILLLYPEAALRTGTIQVDTTVPYPVRLGAVLNVGGIDYKVVWDLKEDNLEVFNDSDGASDAVASGRVKVQALWQKLLGLLPLEHVPTMHFHDFLEANPVEKDEDERSRLINEYRRALTIENIELELDSAKANLRELTEAKTPAARVERALNKVNAKLKEYDRLPELTEPQREFLSTYERTLKQRSAELNEIDGGIADTQRRRAALSLSPLITNYIFWAGVLIGVGCTAAALILGADKPAMRNIALGNILGFGLATFMLVRYIGLHERNSTYRLRLNHLESRRGELSKARDRDGIRLKRLGSQFGSKNADQILIDVDHRNSLLEKRTKLEARLKTHLVDPVFIKQREEIEKTRKHLSALKTKRATFGDFVLPTHELRPGIEALGVSVKTIKPLDAAPESPIVEVAQALKLLPAQLRDVPANKLDSLNKLVGPLLGDRMAKVSIDDGMLHIASEMHDSKPLRDFDDRTQRPWLRAIAMSVLLAHNKLRKSSGDHVSVLLLAKPWAGMQSDERVRVYGLYKEFAKAFQVILPKLGE